MILHIQPASFDQVRLLRQFSIATFTDTYATYNTPQNMVLYIDTYFTETVLAEELANPQIQYFLAFTNDEMVGYIKLRTIDEPAELIGRNHIEIERIYVHSQYKGMHVGKKLISQAIEIARQQGFEIIWLGVWEENKKAMAFYEKQGFTVFGEHDFVLGTEPQRDWLMMKVI